MAALQRAPGCRKWRALFFDESGKRVCRSTGETDFKKARSVAIGWEKGARLARQKLLTADRARAVINEMLEAIGHRRLDQESLRAFATRWLAGKEAMKAAGTATRYGQVIRVFLTGLGAKADMAPSAITAMDIEERRNWLIKAGRSPATVRLEMKSLATLFNAARKQGLITLNPVDQVELDNSASGRREAFTVAELKSLLAVSKDTDWATAVRVGLYTGLRLRDCADMKWGAVDLENGTLTITPKKNARQGRTLTVPLHADLQAYLESLNAPDDPQAFLCAEIAEKPTGGRMGLSRQFLVLLNKAGINREDIRSKKDKGRAVPSKSFHSLRHTFNTMLVDAGVDEAVRMALSGHSTATQNRKYSHLAVEQYRVAVAKIPTIER